MPANTVRWIAPLAVTALVVGGGVAASATSDAAPDLPARTAEELLVAVGEATPVPFSGTVRTDANLGLPDLGMLTGSAGGAMGGSDASGSDPTSALTGLLSGENELRVWVGGAEQQRVSLIDDYAELDVRRDGDELWAYSSAEDTATRYDLAAMGERARAAYDAAVADGTIDPEQLRAEHADAEAPYADLTPAELAQQLVAEADPTTEVAVGENQVVAGRDAYTLTITPRDAATLVGTASVAVDAETGLVLRVELEAKGQAEPAFVTGFTQLDLTAPAADVFAFTPAPGTTVVDGLAEADAARAEADATGQAPETSPEDATDAPEPVVHGEGWSTVLELALPGDLGSLTGDAAASAPSTTDGPAPTDGAAADVDPGQLLDQLTTPVDGGRVLTSALLTVLLTDDGRVFVGPVDAATLQSYAG